MSRTASSEAKNRPARPVISSTVDRPPDRAHRCSTTSASVNRAEWAHSPTLLVDQHRHRSPPSSGRPSPARPSTPAAPAPRPPPGRPRPPRSATAPPAALGVSEWSFAGPGGQRRLVIGPHPQRRRLVARPLAFQLGLDLGAALGKRPQLRPAEADHLPGVVPVRTPRHPQPQRQQPLQLVLVHRPGRPAPLDTTGRASNATTPTIRAPLHQSSGPDNGYATEGRPPATCDARTPPPPSPPSPPGGAPRPTCTRATAALLLQEPQRRLHRLPMGGRHHLGHRLRAERPQQRHALRSRERQIERPHRPGPKPRHQVRPGRRMTALDQRPQLVGLHHPRQAQSRRPTAPPTPPATPPPRRSTRRSTTPPTRSDTRHPTTPSPSTPPTTPNPIASNHHDHHPHPHHPTAIHPSPQPARQPAQTPATQCRYRHWVAYAGSEVMPGRSYGALRDRWLSLGRTRHSYRLSRKARSLSGGR